MPFIRHRRSERLLLKTKTQFNYVTTILNHISPKFSCSDAQPVQCGPDDNGSKVLLERQPAPIHFMDLRLHVELTW